MACFHSSDDGTSDHASCLSPSTDGTAAYANTVCHDPTSTTLPGISIPSTSLSHSTAIPSSSTSNLSATNDGLPKSTHPQHSTPLHRTTLRDIHLHCTPLRDIHLQLPTTNRLIHLQAIPAVSQPPPTTHHSVPPQAPPTYHSPPPPPPPVPSAPSATASSSSTSTTNRQSTGHVTNRQAKLKQLSHNTPISAELSLRTGTPQAPSPTTPPYTFLPFRTMTKHGSTNSTGHLYHNTSNSSLTAGNSHATAPISTHAWPITTDFSVA